MSLETFHKMMTVALLGQTYWHAIDVANALRQRCGGIHAMSNKTERFPTPAYTSFMAAVELEQGVADQFVGALNDLYGNEPGDASYDLYEYAQKCLRYVRLD